MKTIETANINITLNRTLINEATNCDRISPTVSENIHAIDQINKIVEFMGPGMLFGDYGYATFDFAERVSKRHDITNQDYTDLLYGIAELIFKFHNGRGYKWYQENLAMENEYHEKEGA